MVWFCQYNVAYLCLLQQDGDEVIMTKHTIRAARSRKSISFYTSNFTNAYSCS